MFFGALRERLEDDTLRNKALALQLLEEQTAGRVADVLHAMEIDLGDESPFIARSLADGADAAGRPWIEMIEATLEIEPNSIVAYRQLEALLPDRSISRVLIEHADALIEFCERERSGDLDGSLAPVIAILSTESRDKLAGR